jgi:hypothetical protein
MPQHASAEQHEAAKLFAVSGEVAANAAELDISSAAVIKNFFFMCVFLS